MTALSIVVWFSRACEKKSYRRGIFLAGAAMPPPSTSSMRATNSPSTSGMHQMSLRQRCFKHLFTCPRQSHVDPAVA